MLEGRSQLYSVTEVTCARLARYEVAPTLGWPISLRLECRLCKAMPWPLQRVLNRLIAFQVASVSEACAAAETAAEAVNASLRFYGPADANLALSRGR